MFKKILFSFHNFQDRHLPRIFSYCHITGSSQWASRQDYSAGIPKGLIFYFIIPHKIELLLAGNNSCRCFFCKITENFPKYPLKGTKARKQRFQFTIIYLFFLSISNFQPNGGQGFTTDDMGTKQARVILDYDAVMPGEMTVKQNDVGFTIK